MSTIKADTFVDLSREAAATTPNSIGTEYLVEGTAKAWCKFDGTGTVAVDDSFNVASLTDTGTGDQTVNFSITMDNSQHCTVGASSQFHCPTRTSSATACALQTLSSANALIDTAEVFSSTFGDLA